jgi:PadR family transcriptional regulator, regulatory protein PadR
MSAPAPYLGEFEQLVLLAVLRLGDEAYAVPIRQAIEEAASRSVSRGALYTTLERLEAKGLLSSRIGEPHPDRGGRARRYHAVTPLGLRSLRAARDAVTRLSTGLESTLGRFQNR